MIKRAASVVLLCALWAGPAIAQSQMPPNADLDELLGNRQFGEDIPSLVGPNIGIDEPLLNFKSQSHFNVYRSTGELPQTIQPGLNGQAIMRDRNGRVIGYVITGYNGAQYVKDRTGRYLGTLTQGPGGQMRIKDRNGKIVGQVR